MGRSPCCDKVGLKRGPWTPEEDQKLLAYTEEHGHGSWRLLPAKAGLQRCGKSCRLRWTNYLRPDIKRGKFSLQEEQTIIQLHALLGNRWSAIATHLPKRTDNEIKNYWNTHLKKRLDKMGIDPVTHKPKSAAFGVADGQTKSAANLSHMAQWESARLEAEARLVRESKLRAAAMVPSSHMSSQAKAASPPCLDVLKAWQGIWPATKQCKGGATTLLNGDLESPTSTLSFGDNNAAMAANQIRTAAPALDFIDGCKKGEEEIKCNFPLHDFVFLPDGSWVNSAHSAKGSGEEDEAPAYMDGFTGMLFDNVNGGGDDRNSSDGGEGDSDNAADDGDDDESKNYWITIFDMVNSSPANSTLF